MVAISSVEGMSDLLSPSSNSIAQIASCCSKNLFNISYVLPHLVMQSFINWCSGKLLQAQSMLLKVLERSQPLPKDSERWQSLVEAVGNFIASDMQPLSVVENAGFKQLMYTAEPRFKIPSRPYFTNTVIPAMYTCKREN